MASDWRPIETAPKDQDTEVLIWNGYQMGVARWCDTMWVVEDIIYADDGLAAAPTHWMPLPEPPDA